MHCFADIPGDDDRTPARGTAPHRVRRRGVSVASALVFTVLCGAFATGTYYDFAQSRAEAAIPDLVVVHEPTLQMVYEEADPSEQQPVATDTEVEAPSVDVSRAVEPKTRVAKSKPKKKEAPQDLFVMDLGGIGAPVKRAGPAPLSSDREIGAMVGKLLRRYERADVRRCYENRLKGGAELEGSWTVRFTVKPDGTTRRVSVAGAGVRDAELEGCLSRAVADWRFSPIASEFEVQKAFALKPWS